MGYLPVLKEVFEEDKYKLAFAVLVIILNVVFALTSNIIIPSTLELNPILDVPKAVLVEMIVVLISVNLTVLFRNYQTKKDTNKKTTFVGAITALFTTACPVCQPAWLVWLGFGSFTGFLADLSLYIALLSISLLLVSLHYSLKSASNFCELNKLGARKYGKSN